MIQFPFRHSPDWFTNYLTDTHMHGFHKHVTQEFGHKWDTDQLLSAAETYFSHHGFDVEIKDQQLWFSIDESLPSTSFIVLKWS